LAAIRAVVPVALADETGFQRVHPGRLPEGLGRPPSRALRAHTARLMPLLPGTRRPSAAIVTSLLARWRRFRLGAAHGVGRYLFIRLDALSKLATLVFSGDEMNRQAQAVGSPQLGVAVPLGYVRPKPPQWARRREVTGDPLWTSGHGSRRRARGRPDGPGRHRRQGPRRGILGAGWMAENPR
jgi:hypothetical protein